MTQCCGGRRVVERIYGPTIPTWQQTLDVTPGGGRLIRDNDIDINGYKLSFNNLVTGNTMQLKSDQFSLGGAVAGTAETFNYVLDKTGFSFVRDTRSLQLNFGNAAGTGLIYSIGSNPLFALDYNGGTHIYKELYDKNNSKGTAGQVLSSTADGTLWVNAPTPPASGWSLAGNAGIDPATNFIGTTDAQPLLFRVNNTKAGLISLAAAGNTAFGLSCLGALTTGIGNVAFGYNNLPLLTTGQYNIGIGSGIFSAMTTGAFNVAIGSQQQLSNASQNISIGVNNLTAVTSGSFNVCVGSSILAVNQIGGSNVAIGASALKAATGNFNTALGTNALRALTTGIDNVCLGYSAGFGIYTGNDNTIVGKNARAGAGTTVDTQYDGSGNVCIGRSAGSFSYGNYNVFIGYQAGYTSAGSNKLYIANSQTVTPLIYGEFDTPRVFINGGFGAALVEYANDAAAAAGTPPIPINGFYKTGNAVKIRIA